MAATMGLRLPAMAEFRLRTDIERAVVDGYALPLGFVPLDLKAPRVGYTVDYTPGEDENPDSYSFGIVVSHEQLAALVDALFTLLPEEVFPIFELGSRDAYRSMDVFLATDPVAQGSFRQTWREFAPFLLEDGSVAAGANSDEPPVEVFLDHWKSIAAHVPLSMRDDVESILARFDLEEVEETWGELTEEESIAAAESRTVLDLSDEFSADVDDLLLELRDRWQLELDDDPTANRDEGGRELGYTLWHATVVLEEREDASAGAYASIWATASSRDQLDGLIEEVLRDQKRYVYLETFAVDRVALDERPDELADLPVRRSEPEVHLVSCEGWTMRPPGSDDPAGTADV